MPDRYAVVGNPIEQSKSPQIHRAFATQTRQDMDYHKQYVELGGFKTAADKFFREGGKGLNITAPFKLDAYEFAHTLTERAKRAGAVNTLALQSDGAILGDTTDGPGLVNDLCDYLGWVLKGKSLLILGAGGAVRGVLEQLLQQQPQQLLIANRTPAKAQALVDLFADLCGAEQGFPVLSASDYKGLQGLQFEVVINATSAGFEGALPPLPDQLLAPGALCYDMSYGSKPTMFMDWANKHGAQECSDGLGMLVGQAAESFALWRGIKPSVSEVIRDLRRSL